MYIIAREGLRQGQLRGGAVGTLMSNMGLELALKQLGIPFARAKVGDRYVLEKMQEKGWRIGAENSGHVILLDKTTTGDGIVAGLQVLAAMASSSALGPLSTSLSNALASSVAETSVSLELLEEPAAEPLSASALVSEQPARPRPATVAKVAATKRGGRERPAGRGSCSW